MAVAGEARDTMTFESVHHPQERPYALVFSQAVVQPISILFLPLMVLTLIAALQHMPVMDLLLWGFPTATLLAFLWTSFKLRREIAEVVLADRMVAIRSVHDVAWRRESRHPGMPLFDVRDYGSWLVIAAGDADYVIAREEWSDYETLRSNLHEAVYPSRSSSR